MKSNIYLSLLAGTLLLGGSLTSCADKDLEMSGPTTENAFEVDEDQYAMGVTISLSQLSGAGSRASLSDIGANGLKDIEEYVNTENLYILFFNLDGTFLFQINKPLAIPIGQSALGNDNQWFIKIPVKDINENLIHYIEQFPFKIAVLANWTFDSDVNLGENLSGWDEFRFNEPLDADGNLVYDELGRLKGDHISLLAHAQRDNVYENTTLHGYDHLTYRTETGPHMGPYTEWVRNYHKSIDEADNDIRNNFDVKKNKYTNPSSKYNDANGNSTAINHFTMDYNNLWQIWYFGSDDSHFDFAAMEGGIRQDWLDLNQQAKRDMVKRELDSPQNFGYPENSVWKMPNYSDLEFTYGISPKYPELNLPDDREPTRDELLEAQSQFDGLVISHPNISWDDNKKGNPLNLNSYDGNVRPHPYIRFTAHADGYVRVIYEAQGGAKLYAHVGTNNTPENNASGYQKDNLSNRFLVNEEGYLVKEGNNSKQIADIPFDPKNVYIYMVEDPDYTPESEEDVTVPMATVYGIEYIESRHLYDADRGAILPTKEYPIPMYGVQDFDPIGEYWEPGVLFNLSQFNNSQKEGYNYRAISLIRSLARVEVKLKKSAFKQKPSHVFMRSMNRSARMTPVDFFTPTDIIWNGFDMSSISDRRRLQNYVEIGNIQEQRIIENTPGVVKEERNIIAYGPFYIGNKTVQSGNKLNEYRRTTAWPFGIWEQQWNWDWNRGTQFVDNFDTYQPGETRAYTGQTVPEYPRILHTRISRSDYCRMTEVDDPDYWHYIMYVPEKNITDADNPGDISDRPKIIHVEIRFNGGPNADNPELDNPEDNMVDNFDDKAAFRLYFTEGGRANLGNFDFTGRESWDNYEYDWDIVKQHWPIIRNHVYTFTVNGSPNLGGTGNVNFQAEAPDFGYGYWNFY